MMVNVTETCSKLYIIEYIVVFLLNDFSVISNTCYIVSYIVSFKYWCVNSLKMAEFCRNM